MSSRRGRAAVFTIAGSISWLSGCGGGVVGGLPASSVYAPSALVEPYVPEGVLVEPGVASAVTLDELLVFADARAPAVREARARVGVAEVGEVEAEIMFPADPVLEVGVGRRSAGGGVGVDFEVSLEQPLEIGGEVGLRREAARAERGVAQAQVNEARWAVHVAVHRHFVGLCMARERREQAARFEDFSESLREVAARQVEAGEVSPLILLLADADLAQTREAVVEASQEEASQRVRLAAVVGWPGEGLPSVEGVPPPVRRAPSIPALLGLMAERHPSLRARELAVMARRAQLDLERREAWPEPTLGLGYGRESSPGGEGADIWMFKVALPLPIWRGSEVGQARARAELRVADEERSVEAARLRSELVEAALSLDAAVERVEVYASGVMPQLEANLALLQRAYALGEVDVHQVSQTRQRLLEATGRYLDARVAYYEAAATLEGLVGAELWGAEEVIP